MTVKLSIFFMLLGSARVKGARKMLMKLTSDLFQVEVTDLEKVVKGEDTLVNERKKIAETIRNDCDGELT